ncbi:sugar ABC transporter substrate-binding protein [Sinomonas terrae]|uniref:Sugar ABC transporter substrate-binding protein n=1 Tax=Sinomonas terrae TaxID=2908838 RepID=A0ABS9U7E4_9MICC|nr:sugar ABC transporter substrate-binding protein [Sinomonas terrae]MCH6472606.1 sugar ABC transporter substrate-binding protein [Sinomonas terrae]
MPLKTTIRRRFAAAAVAAGLLAMTACSSTANSASQPIDKKDIVLVASVINTTNPYMASMIQGAQALSKKLGVPLQIVDSEGSSQTEISKIQAILAQGKKVALMVNTVASSDAPTIVNAVKAAGGYVSIWWNKPDDYEPWNVGNNFVAFQKYSGVQSGECTANALAKSLNGKGNIVALAGVQDSTTSQTRVAGLKEALKAYPNIHLLDTQPANWDPQQALQVTQSLLAKYGNQVNGVWSADDGMTVGSIQAVQNAGRINDVKFASDGLYPPEIKDMQDHMGNDAIVGETFHRGYMAAAIGLYTAYQAATGAIDPSKLPHEKRDSLFQLECVTPQNLSDYTKYDDPNYISSWMDSLIKDGPWNTPPTPLVAGGPEKLP